MRSEELLGAPGTHLGVKTPTTPGSTRGTPRSIGVGGSGSHRRTVVDEMEDGITAGDPIDSPLRYVSPGKLERTR